MAPGAHEQSAAGMGRREESVGRAQTHRADDEGAARRETDPGATGHARGCWWQEAPESCGLDVLGALNWASGDY